MRVWFVLTRRTFSAIRTSTYKNDYRDGSSGWHVETGKPPKPIGAVWLRLYYVRNGIGLDFVQDVR